MQKERSKFLSVSGIKFYKKNNPEIYFELEKRLSDNWKNKSEIKKFEEIAHSIRNEKFNLKHNTKKRIEKILSCPSLFDNYQFLDKRKLEIAEM